MAILIIFLNNDSLDIFFTPNQGQYDDAINIYMQNEKIQLERLGQRHPSYLATKNQIAMCHQFKGK